MNRQILFILVLWTAIVTMGHALAGEVGRCDPLCCDEPCAPVAGEPDGCVCCAQSDDPVLPVVPPAKAAPAVIAIPVAMPVMACVPAPAAALPVLLPDPPPARPVVLRI